jgi:hypothetical protein
MAVTVLRQAIRKKTYSIGKWGFFLTNDYILYQHEFRVNPSGKLRYGLVWSSWSCVNYAVFESLHGSKKGEGDSC